MMLWKNLRKSLTEKNSFGNMRQGFNMFKNILLTFLLQILLASNICNAEEILRFKEKPDDFKIKKNMHGKVGKSGKT